VLSALNLSLLVSTLLLLRVPAGALLTNLVTVLHNYVSHEFAESKKPFCES
jgi:hypothetical protein